MILSTRRAGVAALGVLVMLAAALPSAGQNLPSKLVSTDWLAANYGKLDIRIVDMRTDIRDYWTSHLPAALYLNPEALRWPENGIPAKLMPVEALVALLGRMGISPSTYVVVYSDKNGFMPTHFLWALDYLGHKNCGFLDGGFDKWKREGRFLTQDYPIKVKSVAYPLPQKLHDEVRATIDDVKQAMASGAVLVDVRPRESYTGERGTWKRRGHIPGAVHHFWSADLNLDGSWKSKDELRQGYASLGVTPDKKIIVYCGSGQMSSHTYLVLKYILGFPSVRVYDGGFEEWSGDPQLAVEKSQK